MAGTSINELDSILIFCISLSGCILLFSYAIVQENTRAWAAHFRPFCCPPVLLTSLTPPTLVQYSDYARGVEHSHYVRLFHSVNIPRLWCHYLFHSVKRVLIPAAQSQSCCGAVVVKVCLLLPLHYPSLMNLSVQQDTMIEILETWN